MMFIPLKDIGYAEEALLKVGYKPHRLKGMGYTKWRNKRTKSRFHAYIVDDGIEIHIDKTSKKNGHHYVYNHLEIESREWSRVVKQLSLLGGLKKQAVVESKKTKKVVVLPREEIKYPNNDINKIRRARLFRTLWRTVRQILLPYKYGNQK